MTNIPKALGFVVAGVVIGYLAAALMGGQSFSGVYNQVNNTFREGIKVGTSDQFSISSAGVVSTSATVAVGSDGTALNNITTGTCSLVAADGSYSMAASSTELFSCAATGVDSGDTFVWAKFATSTLAGNLANVSIINATASSTANDSIELKVWNGSGAALVIPANLASSTAWFAIDS
jgi:hypothetical protein